MYSGAVLLRQNNIASLQSGEEMSSSKHCLGVKVWRTTKQAHFRVRAQSLETTMPSPSPGLCVAPIVVCLIEDYDVTV